MSCRDRLIRNKADVQQTITSAILMQEGFFSKEDVLNRTEWNLKFSSLGKYGKKRKEVDVKAMVEESIKFMELAGAIKIDFETRKYHLNLPFPAIMTFRPFLKQ